MKPYVKFSIAKILLDPSQALLTVCSAGGIYLDLNKSNCVISGGSRTPQLACILTPKAPTTQPSSLGTDYHDTANAPS